MSKRFNLKKTKLEGLNILTIKRRVDSRGYLDRLYCERELNTFLKKKELFK